MKAQWSEEGLQSPPQIDEAREALRSDGGRKSPPRIGYAHSPSRAETPEHDSYAEHFRQLYRHPTFRRARRLILQDILVKTRPRPFWNTLSLGCGAGDLERALARQVRHVTALDWSQHGLEVAVDDARRDATGNLALLRANCHAAPLRGPFDLILTVGLLHGLDDEAMRALLRNIFGWLRPGGILYSHDPSYRRLVGAGKPLFRQAYASAHAQGERELDPAWLVHELHLVGYEPVSLAYCDFFANPWAWLFPQTPYPAFEGLLLLDKLLTRTPLLRPLSSSFTVVAVHP